MSIPFTQYLMPDGRSNEVSVNRPEDVELLARGIIARGLCFECEMLSDYRTVSVTVTDPTGDDGEPLDIDGEIAENGPTVLDAVDRLVRRVASTVEGS